MGDRRSPCGRCDYFLNHSRASLQKGRACIGGKTEVKASPTKPHSRKQRKSGWRTRRHEDRIFKTLPRKGTETVNRKIESNIALPIFKTLPRKGTETREMAAQKKNRHAAFSKHCPERGRKRSLQISCKMRVGLFSKHCPERGRKLLCVDDTITHHTTTFSKHCPERGRKLPMVGYDPIPQANLFSKHCPERGRKQWNMNVTMSM